MLLEHSSDLKRVGGKAYHLEKANIKNTPRFFVCPADYFANENEEKVKKLKKDIESKLKDNILYAVRSSGIDEDSNEHSFAGIHESYLNIKKEEVFDYIHKVYQSAFTPRAIQYRKDNHLQEDYIQIAVIIQEMVDADFAGVINTINPLTNNPDEFVISVVRGLGDKLVDGSEDSVDYFISGKRIKRNGEEVLNKKQLENLILLAKEVQQKYDHFQDIEFAIKGNDVYFLQTRDITQYKNICVKERINAIDNSNIIESYYGVTSPLTFSFAKDIYRDVYTSTLKVGRVRYKIMKSLENSLNSMLYYYEGKIYYSLNSWYHVTSIFPFKNSTSYMEDMMGVRSSGNGVKKLKLNIMDMLKVVTIFLHKLVHIQKLSDDFETKFNEIVQPYYGKKLHGSKEEMILLFKTIEKEMVHLFTTPIINDCAVMFFFGRLKAKIEKLKEENKIEILNAAISSDGAVKSVGSAKELIKIYHVIQEDEQLKYDFITLSGEELFYKYHTEGSKIYEMVNKYILEYGSRMANELKLETITMIENPLLFYELIKNGINDAAVELHEDIKIPKKIQKEAKCAKKYIKNRERLRLKRTYIFSVVRNIFLTIGENLYQEKKILDPRDIFYLTKDEIFTGDESKYRSIIEQRKKEENEFFKLPIYDRVVFYKTGKLKIRYHKGSSLEGIGNGYSYTGKIKVMNSPNDEFEKGDILLTKRTDPGWISLFARAGGIIVEHGSLLSHSFVVAREMKIPAVVGVANAMDVLHDGDTVTIDGIKGQIIHENKKVL